MTKSLEQVPMPAAIAALPRNKVGYPIPWFVADLPDGERDFRIASADKRAQALRDDLCWICGAPLDGEAAFVIGPMCAVNRISSEPPSHRPCAVYAVQVCPFLNSPDMQRRPTDRDDTVPAAGEMLERNPGVALVWITASFKVFRPQLGADGLLFELGDPTAIGWYTRGRPATRGEVLAAMAAGLPALFDACQDDDDPAESAVDVLQAAARAMLLVPDSDGPAAVARMEAAAAAMLLTTPTDKDGS